MKSADNSLTVVGTFVWGSGGAGIRTPVRSKIHYNIYVRSLPFLSLQSRPGRRGYDRTRSLEFRDQRETAPNRYPEFAVPGRRVRSAPIQAGAYHCVKRRLRSQGQVVVGSCENSQIFLRGSRNLGTRPQLHQPRRSRSPPYVKNNMVPLKRAFPRRCCEREHGQTWSGYV